MKWNWQKDGWPNWQFYVGEFADRETRFLLNSGELSGAWSHLAEDDRLNAAVDIITDEAMKTSEIEGEYLDRESVRSSVRLAFGLSAERSRGAAESGIADLLMDGFRTWRSDLDEEALFRWHNMVCRGRTDLRDLGNWRRRPDPMRVVSGPIQKSRIHFEAPPSERVPSEMKNFIKWFNASGSKGLNPLPALVRAGLAHLYFVSIHPFEDGNGRIARALCEKALAQAIEHPSLVTLSVRIEKSSKEYYEKLEAGNKSMEAGDWLNWFADIVLDAQAYSRSLFVHLISKARLMDRLRESINERQTKVLFRMFAAGPAGFKGGMSAAKYMRITDASPATARRDLVELVSVGALARTGERKSTRYWLNAK